MAHPFLWDGKCSHILIERGAHRTGDGLQYLLEMYFEIRDSKWNAQTSSKAATRETHCPEYHLCKISELLNC